MRKLIRALCLAVITGSLLLIMVQGAEATVSVTRTMPAVAICQCDPDPLEDCCVPGNNGSLTVYAAGSFAIPCGILRNYVGSASTLDNVYFRVTNANSDDPVSCTVYSSDYYGVAQDSASASSYSQGNVTLAPDLGSFDEHDHGVYNFKCVLYDEDKLHGYKAVESS